ncbi:DUF896 domain-containing protein [Gehongia tenuis]|uniref:DUF896 domain-containing protein n=1 Tax=Gehongia tenuis TaxID=2763655 RepID=UPI0020169837
MDAVIAADKIERINLLARKKRTMGLTEQELEEQAKLRQEYLQAFRADFTKILETVKIEDEQGKILPLRRKNEA